MKPDNPEVVATLGLPCFVKPNESGSSIGITRVTSQDQLWPAVLEARQTGTSTVLVEALLIGREFTCGIVPDGKGGVQALPITEIVSHNDFFDFAAKYDGESHEITPASLDDRDVTVLQRQAKTVYQTLHLQGMARVDMMMEEGGEPHVIEINTVPGFSAQSIIPQQAEVAGMDKTALISRRRLHRRPKNSLPLTPSSLKEGNKKISRLLPHRAKKEGHSVERPSHC